MTRDRVVTVIALVAAALTVFESLNVARIMLSDKGYLIVSLVDGPTPRAYTAIAPWAGMGMPATYAGVVLGLGTVLFHTRDAH